VNALTSLKNNEINEDEVNLVPNHHAMKIYGGK